MKNKMYILLLILIIFYFNTLNAMIGQNIRPVEDGEFPMVVCILRYDPTLGYQWNMQCTGTLITPDFLLTAAHCFGNSNITRLEISFGHQLVDEGQRNYPVWWISYDQWATVTIRNYTTARMLDDILLAKIFGAWKDTSIVLGRISPVNLMYGLDTVMVGCGKVDNGLFPQIMQVGEVRIIDHRTCNELVSHMSRRNVTLPTKYLCSVGIPPAQLRVGDSGGPLIYYGLLIGVNMACIPDMHGPYNPNRINVHVNVERYHQFLNTFVGDN